MFRSISKAVGAVAVVLAVGACADPVSPKAEVDGPAFASGLITINGADLFLASGAGNTIYCGFSGANVFNTEVACPGLNTIAPVVTNRNPGWADYSPTGSFLDAEWLGPVSNSDDYVNLPGTYTYTRTFTIPAGTTNLQMNMQVLADNNTTVEVNGIVIGSQPQTDNTFSTPVDFNATSELQVGLNTLTFIVNNTRVDGTPVGSACPNTPAFYPQPGYDNIACRNPTGFLYSAVVGWDLVPPPAPDVCDFMTFGRLETAINGQKVVISGNAGGRNADGSIKGEMEVSIGGTKYHVHQLDAYGPIAAGTLASSSYTNSRVFSGMSGASLVELRLWDNGETGKGADRVSLTIGGNLILGGGVGGITLDKGNAQYHPNCRGPKD